MANETKQTQPTAFAPRPATAEPASARTYRRWDEEDGGADVAQGAEAQAFRTLTREQAQALHVKQPPLNPWRVVAVQAGVGAVVALLAVLATGRGELAWSALYGAACVVVPGALMARGMTSPLSTMSPGAGAVSIMLWESAKIAVTMVMLVAAPRWVNPLSWPALLAGLGTAISVYWFALLWRGRS